MNENENDNADNSLFLRGETASWPIVTRSFLVRVQAGEPQLPSVDHWLCPFAAASPSGQGTRLISVHSAVRLRPPPLHAQADTSTAEDSVDNRAMVVRSTSAYRTTEERRGTPWYPNRQRSAAQARVVKRSNRFQGINGIAGCAPVLQPGREPWSRATEVQVRILPGAPETPSYPNWQRDTDQSRGGGSSNLPEGMMCGSGATGRRACLKSRTTEGSSPSCRIRAEHRT